MTDAPRMLLVEDNPGDARYIRELLREALEFAERPFPRGDGGAPASDGDTPDLDATLTHETRLADGMDRLADWDPDVVLLDLNLPDSDGLDTLRTVVERHPLVPVVVLTGLRDRDAGVEALREGAEEYLVKDEINPDLLIRSVHHAIERKAHEREQQRYETLIEESTDTNAIVGQDGRIEYITPSVEHVLGYTPDALVGENAFDYVHPEDRDGIRREFEKLVADPDRRAKVECRFERDDGSWRVLHMRGRNLLDDPVIDGLVVYTHDVTERKERERRLERQRERLEALNQLNRVVNGVTAAVIDRSTRDEVEQTACDRLAAADSYAFAWVGEPDPHSQTVAARASAAAEYGLDESAMPATAADEDAPSFVADALRTGEVTTVQNPDAGPVRTDDGEAATFPSAAAIPIVHQDTTYGVLVVYADREDAFRGEEHSVVGSLGEIVGHAIAATERKRALLGDSIVELDLRVSGMVDAVGAGAVPDDPVTLDHAIPVDDGEFLVYGEAAEDELDTVRALGDAIPFWDDVNVVSEQFDGVRFEVRVSDAPVMSAVASLGGSVSEVRIAGGDLQLTVHLPQEVEVRRVVDAVRDTYEDAEITSRRQTTRRDDPSAGVHHVWTTELTDRQRTVVQTAYFAGFFEWPRATSGEEVADALDISPATFSQHLRAAQNKVFGGILGDVDADDPQSP